MAKIKFGMMMTDARGKLGGQVFSKNRSGAYVRTKVTPVNPQTVSQQANRSLLGSLSANWSSLSDTERSAWNNAVEQWQKTNVFGDLMKPTGKNLFTSLNKVMLANFAEREVMALPPSKVEFFATSIVSAVFNTGTNLLTITLSGEGVFGSTVQVRATPPVSNGTTFVKNLFRNIGESFTVSGTGTISAGSAYVARFGDLVAGQKIFIEVRQVATNGQLGVAMQQMIITVV